MCASLSAGLPDNLPVSLSVSVLCLPLPLAVSHLLSLLCACLESDNHASIVSSSQLNVYHASAVGRAISYSLCGDPLDKCRALEAENQRLVYEVLSLQKELKTKDRVAQAFKHTVRYAHELT